MTAETNVNTTKFERVVLEFNEVGFEVQKNEIQIYCDKANEAADIIHKEYGLALTDKELEAIFLNLEVNPDRMIEKYFENQKSKSLREESIQDLKEFIEELLFSLRQFDEKARKALGVKKGRFVVDPIAIENIKQLFETSLDTPRAVEIYNLHHEIFEKYIEFENLLGKSPLHFGLWRYDLNQNLTRKQELNYNKM